MRILNILFAAALISGTCLLVSCGDSTTTSEESSTKIEEEVKKLNEDNAEEEVNKLMKDIDSM
jgi:hypothetical protein